MSIGHEAGQAMKPDLGIGAAFSFSFRDERLLQRRQVALSEKRSWR
jgi:hypothetical protein